ncbi:MAG: TonB-dependent receptor [bacterium]|nr:TonB-dependent receptor [bacterium]
MKKPALLVAGGWFIGFVPMTIATAQSPLPPTAPSGQGTAPQESATQEPEEGRQKPAETTTTAPFVVTAQKWGEESVRDVPMSVTPIGAKQIRDAGIRSVPEAARYVPNTFVTGFSARRLSFPFVRGVGSGQGDPAVATFIDDVPQLSVSSTNVSLVGIERVEFLRGPNSALWGRNTVGGAINLITREPSFRGRADANVTLGNFDSQLFEVDVSGPIMDDVLAFGFSGSYEQRDGFTTNTITGRDVDSRDSAFGRAQLLWTPNDSSTVRLILHGEETRDGGFVLSPLDGPGGLRSNPFRVAQDFDGRTERDILAATVIWEQKGDQVDFKSITSAQGWDIDESADFDFSLIDGVRRFTNEKQDYLYQEFRLESAADNKGPRWLVGTSGFYSDSTRAASNVFRPGGAGVLFPAMNVGTDRSSGNFEDHAFSVFGQLAVDVGERVEVTAAVRYDYERTAARITRTFDPGGFTVPVANTDQDRTFDRVLPRVAVKVDACDNVTAYASAAHGFKAGGFNLTAPAMSESFGTEKSWTYELGAKSEWADGRFTANAAAFYVDWDDMQLSQFDSTAGGYVTNAGASNSAGVELELTGEVADGLALFGSAGWMTTEFDAFVDQFGQNVAGNDLPFAPEFTLAAGAQYTLELDNGYQGFARFDWFYVGDFYYDAGNLGQESFDLANFRIGGGGENWRLEGFLNNAFEEEYIPLAFQANPADPSQFVGFNAAPQTWGVSMRVFF